MSTYVNINRLQVRDKRVQIKFLLPQGNLTPRICAHWQASEIPHPRSNPLLVAIPPSRPPCVRIWLSDLNHMSRYDRHIGTPWRSSHFFSVVRHVARHQLTAPGPRSGFMAVFAKIMAVLCWLLKKNKNQNTAVGHAYWPRLDYLRGSYTREKYSDLTILTSLCLKHLPKNLIRAS